MGCLEIIWTYTQNKQHGNIKEYNQSHTCTVYVNNEKISTLVRFRIKIYAKQQTHKHTYTIIHISIIWKDVI